MRAVLHVYFNKLGTRTAAKLKSSYEKKKGICFHFFPFIKRGIHPVTTEQIPTPHLISILMNLPVDFPCNSIISCIILILHQKSSLPITHGIYAVLSIIQCEITERGLKQDSENKYEFYYM